MDCTARSAGGTASACGSASSAPIQGPALRPFGSRPKESREPSSEPGARLSFWENQLAALADQQEKQAKEFAVAIEARDEQSRAQRSRIEEALTALMDTASQGAGGTIQFEQGLLKLSEFKTNMQETCTSLVSGLEGLRKEVTSLVHERGAEAGDAARRRIT